MEPEVKQCPACERSYGADASFCPRDGTRLVVGALPPRDPYVGKDIGHGIVLRERVGEGAMGCVYRAFQSGVDRDVAVKILRREVGARAELAARFHREAKVASRLSHPSVVHVYLTGQLDDGALFIVMEFLAGVPLDQALVAAGGAMPLVRALHVVLQVCAAVGEAHAHGIVHRDIKPENVMLLHRGDDTDFVKVLDFGIARLAEGETTAKTAAGIVLGTPRYMAPEAARGEVVGPPADVYAVATVLYQLLSGRTPFQSETVLGFLIQHAQDTPPPLRSLGPAAGVPEQVAAVVMANLAKDPKQRAPDARAFGRALIEAAQASGLQTFELMAHSRLLRASIPVEPTLDDVTAGATRESARPSAGRAPASASLSAIAATAQVPSVRTPEPRRSALRWVLFSLIGVALLGGGVLVGRLITPAPAPQAAQNPALDAHLAKIRAAMDAHRMYPLPDQPSTGDTAKELLAEGFRRWPTESRLRSLRDRVVAEILASAVAEAVQGDRVESTRLARVVLEIDPGNPAANSLVSANVPRAPVSFEISPEHPRAGERIEVRVRWLADAGRLDDPELEVSSGDPTKGRKLTLADTPGGKRAGFSSDAGRFELRFRARQSGTDVASSTWIDVAPVR